MGIHILAESTNELPCIILDFGLRVTYDHYAVNVLAPRYYRTHVCGICGNWDNNKSNDNVAENEWFLNDGRPDG